MNLGLTPFTPIVPRWNGNAQFPTRRRETVRATIGACREFHSRQEAAEYESAFRSWTPTTPVPDQWLSAAWLGHRDAEAAASDELRSAA